jgi:transposase-like protein
MGNIKRKHSAAFKTEVAIDLIRGAEALSVVCSKRGVHPTQARRWKEQALSGLPTVFSDNAGRELQQKDELIEELYRQIGQLKVELDWLKKKVGTAF